MLFLSKASNKLRKVCSSFEDLLILNEADTLKNGAVFLDSTKVTVNFAAWGYSGVEVAEKLREEKIAVELTDEQNVLFLVTYADVGTKYEAALESINKVLPEIS